MKWLAFPIHSMYALYIEYFIHNVMWNEAPICKDPMSIFLTSRLIPKLHSALLRSIRTLHVPWNLRMSSDETYSLLGSKYGTSGRSRACVVDLIKFQRCMKCLAISRAGFPTCRNNLRLFKKTSIKTTFIRLPCQCVCHAKAFERFSVYLQSRARTD